MSATINQLIFLKDVALGEEAVEAKSISSTNISGNFCQNDTQIQYNGKWLFLQEFREA